MPRPDLLDVELDELVAGRRPVEEAFVARREARRLLVVPQRRQALEKLVLHATNLRIPIVEVEGGTLTALAGFDGHQGIALVVAPRRYAEMDDILARSIERGEPPFILVLDSLEDPQNVGSLLRSAEAAGTHGVIFPTHHQAPLTPSAVKASAGAVEHLLMAPVDDLAGVLADLHVRGLRIVGADAEASLTVREADLRGPLALVVGSEGQGLGPAVRRRCDLLVRIPMRGAVGSLNASVAGSILLYEATTQRGGAETSVERTRVESATLVADGTTQAAETSPPSESVPGDATTPVIAAPVVAGSTPKKSAAQTAAAKKSAAKTAAAKAAAAKAAAAKASRPKASTAKTAAAKTSRPRASAAKAAGTEPALAARTSTRKAAPSKKAGASATAAGPTAGPGRKRRGSTVETDDPADALLPADAAASPATARPRKRRSAPKSDPAAERG